MLAEWTYEGRPKRLRAEQWLTAARVVIRRAHMFVCEKSGLYEPIWVAPQDIRSCPCFDTGTGAFLLLSPSRRDEKMKGVS